MRRFSRISSLSLFLTAMLTLAACSGGGNGGGVFVGLLDTIPDTPETREFVIVSDFALVREMFDIRLRRTP